MILKLGARNLLEKPGKAVATILVIAFAVAILFCIMSYNTSVQDYLYAVETANPGNSDITISYRSDGARIVNTESLAHLKDDFEYVVGALSIYGIYENDGNDSYIYLRGLDRNNIETLHKMEFVKGGIEDLKSRSDNVAISETTAKELGIDIDSELSITVMNVTKTFYVSAIAKDDGLFAKNSPYTVIGLNNGVTRFFGSEWGGLYSEIFIKLKDGVSATTTIDAIKAIPEYRNMKVDTSTDANEINRKADNLAAPVKIVGIAVIFLALMAVILLFATNERAKRVFISKMTSIGATKKQIAGITAVETSILAVIGSVLGVALAVLIYWLLLKWTIGTVMNFKLAFWKLMLSMISGIAVTMLAGFIPMLLGRRSSLRENLVASSKTKNKQKIILLICLLILIALALVLEFTTDGINAGYFGIVAFALIIIVVTAFSPMILTLLEKLAKRSKKPNLAFSIATLNTSRAQSSRRSMQIMSLGMTISMLLFVAWNLTTSIFSGLTAQFNEMILVTNIPADESLKNELEEVEGVRSAVLSIWQQAQFESQGEKHNLTILGAKEILDSIDFEYITQEEKTKEILAAGLSTDERYVFLDYAYTVLYGVGVGDSISLQIEDKTAEFKVGGILKSELFTGNYAVIAREQLSDAFGLPLFDTVMLFTDNAPETASLLRTTFADRNFFIVGAIESFEYEVDAFSSVFDLIGILAFIIASMVLASVISNTAVARIARFQERGQYLVAGMSKKTLFSIEVLEHILIAVVGAVLAFSLSAILTICLIDILLLLGVYLEYMFATLPALLVTVAIGLAYIIMPFVGNYKRSYTLQTRE